VNQFIQHNGDFKPDVLDRKMGELRTTLTGMYTRLVELANNDFLNRWLGNNAPPPEEPEGP